LETILGQEDTEEFKKRIPRHLITLFKEKMEDIVNYYNREYGTRLKIDITGSYRRGAETSGDIDMVISSTVKNEVAKYFPYIKNYRMLDKNDHEIPANTEKEIFNILGFDYVTPEERNL